MYRNIIDKRNTKISKFEGKKKIKEKGIQFITSEWRKERHYEFGNPHVLKATIFFIPEIGIL